MEFTGERVVPGQVDADLWQEHVSRYEFALTFVNAGARVLDAGCGAGYGAARLAAAGASEVVGIDSSSETVAWAAEHYQAANLHFTQGDITELLDFDSSFDLVVAFEVIEHLPDATAFLKEARRVLKKDGVLLVSTPNRRFYTEERGFLNPFHTREYDASEYRELLQHHFAHCVMLEQNHVPAISFLPQGGQHGTVLSTAAPSKGEPHFFLAICSQQPLEPRGMVYLPESGNVLREREIHIHKLEKDIADLQEQTNKELAERRQWAEKLEAQLREKGEVIGQLQQELQDRTDWATQLEEQIRKLDAAILERQKAVQGLEANLEERATWAKQLEERIAERDTLVIERQKEVERLEAEVRQRTAWASALDAEIEVARTRLNEAHAQIDEAHARLNEEHARFNEVHARLNEALAEMNRREQARLIQVQELEQELERRAKWAFGLNDEIEALRSRLQSTIADLQLVLDSNWYRVGKRLALSPVPQLDRRKQP